MIVDRVDADGQRVGDLFTGSSLSYKPKDFALAWCEFILTHMHPYSRLP